MNGGKMYQHVTNHTGNHNIYDVLSQQQIMVSSTHHQMMIPNEEGTVLAFAKQHGIREVMINTIPVSRTANDNDKDTEIVYYTKTRSLCFQPHPEFRSLIYDNLRGYFFRLVARQFN